MVGDDKIPNNKHKKILLTSQAKAFDRLLTAGVRWTLMMSISILLADVGKFEMLCISVLCLNIKRVLYGDVYHSADYDVSYLFTISLKL